MPVRERERERERESEGEEKGNEKTKYPKYPKIYY